MDRNSRRAMFNWAACLKNVGPPLTRDEIALIERFMGFELPHQLRALYQALSRGEFVRHTIEVPGGYFVSAHYVLDAKPTAPQVAASAEVAAVYIDLVEDGAITPDLIPFAKGPGSTYLGIRTSDGKIVDVVLDTYFDDVPPRVIAPSLEAFFEAMTHAATSQS